MIFLSFFLFLNFGCDTAILSLTEQFKEELDNHKVISLVSMDLSKAFDTLPHDLIVKKLEDYGGDSKVINLVTNYLSDRHQPGAPNGNFRENICSEDDLRSRIFYCLNTKLRSTMLC